MMMGGFDDSPLSDESKKTIDTLFLSIHLNMGAVYLKMNEFNKAITACTKAIKIDPNSAKAYFRRSQAHLSVKDVDRAEEDGKKALSLEPNDKAIKLHLKNVQKENERQLKEQAKTFKGMFNKVSLYDDKEADSSSNPSPPSPQQKIEEVEENWNNKSPPKKEN